MEDYNTTQNEQRSIYKNTTNEKRRAEEELERLIDFNNDELDLWANSISHEMAEIFKNKDIRDGKSLSLIISAGPNTLKDMGLKMVHIAAIMKKIESDKGIN